MNKYSPLQETLEKLDDRIVPLSFSEIENILGFRLPNSARTHRPWWANDSKTHSQSRAWLAAGFKSTEVNLEGETIVFRKQNAQNPTGSPSTPETGQHPLFGCMKGSVTFVEGVDLTKPAMPEWADIADAAELPDG